MNILLLHLHLFLFAITAVTAEPAHPARQVSISGSSIFERAVCNFGQECGTGCTEGNDTCCDTNSGISCPAGSSCIKINGQTGCCPEGRNCTWIQGCRDFSKSCGDDICCPSDVPICDVGKKICVASSFSPSSPTAVGSAESTLPTAAAPPSVTAADIGSGNPNSKAPSFPSLSHDISTPNSVPTAKANANANAVTPIIPPYAKGNSSFLPPEFRNASGYGNITIFTGAAMEARSLCRSFAILVLLWPLAMGFALL
ncbi:hypothetical protein BZA77DRAFT_308118 [Pyronema omphalodes]|nr:hypothetical protein BZA77DRAFT_308118 [Pyronema omphalodes]